MQAEVIIAARNEPDLEGTRQNILDNSGATVRVMEDKKGQGCMLMRHMGIAHSRADVVIVMDGHMRVRPGALDAMAEHVAEGKRVACLKCWHSETPWEGTLYAGASMLERSKESGGRHWVLPAKWRSDPAPGRIGAVMGACYAFRRDWYMDGLGAPWKWGTGWGQDEETLSVVNYLSGGETELLDMDVWHQYQQPGRYRNSEWQLAGVWAQRFRTVHMLPVSQQLRQDWTDWLNKNGNTGGFNRSIADKVTQICRQTEDEVREYRDERKWSRSWWQFEQEVLGRETPIRLSKSDLYKEAKRLGLASRAASHPGRLHRGGHCRWPYVRITRERSSTR